MYNKLLKVKKNKITINLDYFRSIYNDDNDYEIIEKIIKINDNVLTKYKTFIYIVPMNSLSITDIYYLNFYKKLIDKLESKYADELETMYFTETNLIFQYIFNIMSSLLTQKTLERIKIE